MPRRKKVLLVDDEPGVLLGLMRTLLKDNDRYDVLVATSGEIAQQILSEQHIHVLLTDISMPGMSGIDLLLWVAQECPDTQVGVITATDVEQIRGQAYRLGAVSIVKKPFNVAAVRSLVLSLLDNTSALSGRLSRLAVPDLLQMLCLSRQTVALRVDDGDEGGVIMVQDGDVRHALWGELKGEQAVYRALRAEEGTFQTLEYPDDTPQTITENWQHLLLEGMRLQDEEAAGIGQPLAATSTTPAPAPPKAAPPPDVDPDPELAARLLQEGFDLLKQRDREGALAKWKEALAYDPENHVILLNVRKLARAIG